MVVAIVACAVAVLAAAVAMPACVVAVADCEVAVAADALAIGVGHVLGARLPERVIRIGAAIAFVIFGVLLIVEGLRG